VTTTIEMLEALAAAYEHASIIRDRDAREQVAGDLASEVAPLVPLLRTLVDADTEWTEAVVGASTISFEECTRRAGVADDAVQALLAALTRGTP
jgi:hypothetical protein